MRHCFSILPAGVGGPTNPGPSRFAACCVKFSSKTRAACCYCDLAPSTRADGNRGSTTRGPHQGEDAPEPNSTGRRHRSLARRFVGVVSSIYFNLIEGVESKPPWKCEGILSSQALPPDMQRRGDTSTQNEVDGSDVAATRNRMQNELGWSLVHRDYKLYV